MSKEKFGQKESYDIIVSDSEAIIKYVDELKKGKKIGGKDAPAIVKLYINPDDKSVSNKKEEQMKLAKSVGGAGAMIAAAGLSKATIGAIGIGGVSSLVGGTFATGLGFAGLLTTSVIPGIGLPFMLAGLGIAAGKAIMTFKNKEKTKELKEKLESTNKYLVEICKKMEIQYKEKAEKYSKKIEELIKKYSDIAKDKAKKAAIVIDDALNTDVNQRIMQYQQIALNQYADIKNLNDDFAELQKKYNETIEELSNILSEYKKLEKEMEDLLVELEKYRRLVGAVEAKKAYLSSDK